MAESKQASSEFNSEKLILFIFKKSKIIAICCILAVIFSAVFSSTYFITPLFESTVIFYPTASNSISKSVLSNGGGQDILAFGEEEETEKLLQILNSSIIRDSIIEKFNLLEHYNIPLNAEFRRTKLFRKYGKNVKFSRTEYMAVEVKVYDSDAQIAADMANEIALLLDETKTKMHQERARFAFKIVEHEYLRLQHEIKLKEDSLSFLRSKGVFEYNLQVERINQQLAIDLGAGNDEGVKRLEERLSILAKYGKAYINLSESMRYDVAQLNNLKIRYQQAKVDAEKSLSHKFIVDNAFKAEKKSYPIRWLIVLMSTLSVFFLSIIILLAIESVKKLKL